MGRGKIEIKLIENPTNRQVTYSKRRNGIFKKAHELSVLCDAKVSLIMFSKNNKMHEYITPGLTTKKMVDQYQKALGNIDLWRAHYERMLENLRKLKEINNKLRKQIRNRLGADLEDLSFDQLRNLEDEIINSSALIRVDDEATVGVANGGSNLYAFCQHHTHHLNLHHQEAALGFKPHDLRLA
ncbi:floral homeotic protein DEFICIENS-like isoform X2 [Senna tora]|uniref:Floral homeotic protein DEFICIENS-like isoform X2 n=1 Tax=Senna tora TaxID=362788 RepID=A0A834WR91_9FABA|nr:floral homeotic protein DEFICIENS-like isoform X2 [Senna tora]